MNYTLEVMSDEFTKHHLGFDKLNLVVHHFTAPDKGGPHDHPFRFTTHILKGSYVERIWSKDYDGKWYSDDVLRAPGTSHILEAECIHELIDLPEGDCWTVMIPEVKTREWRFWQFRETGIFSRVWNEQDWQPYQTINRSERLNA